MQLKKIFSRISYIIATLLMLTIFAAELSPKINFFTLEKLGLSGMAIAFLVLAGILRKASMVHPEQKQKAVHDTLWLIFLYYLVYLIWILYFDGFYNRTSLETDFQTYFVLKTNFVPFVTIDRYISNISNDAQTGSAILNLVGNLAAFMPMGFFGPRLIRPMRRAWIFVSSLLMLLIGVEGLQLLLRVGSCDVDDVILNLLGALIIYGFVKLPIIQRRLNLLN